MKIFYITMVILVIALGNLIYNAVKDGEEIIERSNQKLQTERIGLDIQTRCIKGHEFILYTRDNAGGISQHFGDDGLPIKCGENNR